MSAVAYRVEGDVAVLTVDAPPVNALGLAVRQGLLAGLDRAVVDDAVAAVVLICAGSTFIAGADISEFGTAKALAEPRIRTIQDLLEASSKPVVAAIHGTALGGGLEVALACHARVAVASAKLGLPEVKLGLLPGAGGTVRLPRLVGPEVALDMITSGAPIAATRALELGVIDVIVEDLEAGAIAYAAGLATDGAPLPVMARDERLRDVDPALFADYRLKVGKKARGQIAPFRIVDCVEAACRLPGAEALAFEAAAFAELLASDQRKGLVHYFFAEREARKIPGLPTDLAPQPIRKVAVIGAGLMGGGIAMVFANAGIAVTLVDVGQEALERGLGVIRKTYAASVARGSTPQAKADRALALIHTTTDYAELRDVDLAIEAVFENMGVKQAIFARLDAATPAHAILASNTSGLDIDAIASATLRPERVIGIHFFSPANVMKLMENVRGAQTSPEVIATVMALGRQLGKVPVLAGNCDGFIGNRMLQYYSGEAEFMLIEGATPEQVDRVAESFGMAMGPLAMRDLSALDLNTVVRAARREAFPDERCTLIVERLVEAGRCGQKTSKGYYRYEGRTRLPDPEALAIIEAHSRELGVARRAFSDEEIRDRLFMPLVNEGAKELEEGIALRAGDIDVVWVNGYAFPAHRGGPMFWGEQMGLDKVAAMAERLAAANGERWAPGPLLRRLAETGRGWSAVGEVLAELRGEMQVA
ncbi:3-hydroxyacyl-CoA dehydrogenase NAD-binding domain-containing protein [Caulobacter sp. LARHSG274]